MGRGTLEAHNHLAALFRDAELPGLQELVALPTLENLSFKFDILFQ
jgi:hypothetical protein